MEAVQLLDHQQKGEREEDFLQLLCACKGYRSGTEAGRKIKEERLDLKNQVSALKQKLLAYQARRLTLLGTGKGI